MLPAPVDCLISLLGLAASPPACFPFPADADAQAAITASSTGLYLTMAEGLELRIGAAATAATDLWQRLDNARALAAGQVRLLLAGNDRRGLPLYEQRGALGGAGNGQLAPVGTLAQLSFYTYHQPSGALRLTQVKLYTDQSVAAVPLLLDGQLVGQIPADPHGGLGLVHTLPAAGLLVPLDGQTHTLEAVLPPGVRVRANSFFAGCFDCQKETPWFLSVKRNLREVAASTQGAGFSISMEEVCAAPEFLCFATGNAEDSPELRYPEVAKYVAHALLYKAAELFTVGILTGASTNRYTMLEPKMLAALAERYQAKTLEYTAWLASPNGLGQVQHPCYLKPPARGQGLLWTG
jgi:hypothetical protein